MDLSESRTVQSPDYCSSSNVQGKMGKGEMEDDRGMVIEVEGMVFVRNLGMRQILKFMRAGISVCVVVVVVRGVFGEYSLSVMEVECSGVGFQLVGVSIFMLSRAFVVVVVVVEVEMEDSELGVECVIRLF